MRIYDVHYAHVRFGGNFSRCRVAVRGYAQDAIRRASKHHDVVKLKKALRVESVELIAST